MIKNIFAAVALGVVALGAQASTNLVANGGFNGSTGDYVYNGVAPTIAAAYPGFGATPGTVADWDGSFVSIASGSGPWGSPVGQAHSAGQLGGYVAGLQSDGTLSQTLTLDAGVYSLSWIDAGRQNYSNQSYSVSFDGQVLATPFTTVAGAGWNHENLIFTVGADTTATLTFTGLVPYTSGDATAFIDNVSVTAVPEPSAMVLMAFGALGLVGWRRRSQV